MGTFDYDDASGALAVGGLMVSGMKFSTKKPKIRKGLGRMQDRLDCLEKVLEAADYLDGSDVEEEDDDEEESPSSSGLGGAARFIGKEVARTAVGAAVAGGVGVMGGGGAAAAAGAAGAAGAAAAPEVAGFALASSTLASGTAGAAGATAGGVGAAVLAPLAAIPVALTTPLWLGAFRVRSDVVIEVCKGVKLVDGKLHLTSGSFGSAFRLNENVSQDAAASELTSILEERRAQAESTVSSEFPTTLEEGLTCVQLYNAWGSARGCCGFISFRIDGTKQHFVCVVSNAFDRNLHNLSCGVCISDCEPKSEDGEANALYALCEKHFSDHGFAGIDFSTDVEGAMVSANGKGFRGEARMTSFRASTAWFKVTHNKSKGVKTPASTAATCARIRTALQHGSLAASLVLTLEASCTANTRKPRGRLTYVNGGGGCARKMTVAYVDKDGVPQEEVCDSHVLVLPEGAHTILVKFYVIWGSTVKQVDRAHPAQPWIRASDNSYPEEVCDVAQGDGTDAFFEVCGTSLHSYVHRAWNFGRDPKQPPGDWEWWGEDDALVAAAGVAFLPGESELRARLDAIQDDMPVQADALEACRDAKLWQ